MWLHSTALIRVRQPRFQPGSTISPEGPLSGPYGGGMDSAAENPPIVHGIRDRGGPFRCLRRKLHRKLPVTAARSTDRRPHIAAACRIVGNSATGEVGKGKGIPRQIAAPVQRQDQSERRGNRPYFISIPLTR